MIRKGDTKNANDAKGNENLPFPKASSPDMIELELNFFLVVIEFDLLAYKKRTSSTSVKKTLSIPQWLNEEALSLNINFSQVLQDALMEIVQKNTHKYNMT